MLPRGIWQSFFLLTLLVGLNDSRAQAETKGGPKSSSPEGMQLPARAVARLGSLAFSHGEIIGAVALAPNGKIAATAGREKMVMGDQGKDTWAFDPNIRLWEIPAGRQFRVIQAPEGLVLALDFSPDGKSLAAGVGKKVYQWDVTSGQEIHHFRMDESVSLVRFTPDGKHLLLNLGNQEILRWDLEKRTENVLWRRKKLDGKLYVHSLDLSPDGSQLAIALAKLPAAAAPGAPAQQSAPPHLLQVLDLCTGQLQFEAKGKAVAYCLALSPDKKQLVSGNERLTFWDLARQKKLRELPPVAGPPLLPFQRKIPPAAQSRLWDVVSFSPDSRLVASAHSSGVFLWQAESGKKICEMVHSLPFIPYLACEVFAFSQDSRLLAVGGSEVLRLLDTVTGKEIGSWPGHRLPVADFRFAPDGKTLATRNHMDVCSWQTNTWQPLARHSLVPHQNKGILAISTEKNWLITWVKDEIFLEDLATGKILLKFALKDKKFDSAQFSFHGEAACLTDHFQESGISAVVFSLPDGKELFQLELEHANSFTFSPVRNTITWKDRDGTYFEADGRTGKVLSKLNLNLKPDPDGLPPFLANTIYSWDGKYLVLQQEKADGGSELRFWNVETGRTTHHFKFPPKVSVGGMDISFDSRLMWDPLESTCRHASLSIL